MFTWATPTSPAVLTSMRHCEGITVSGGVPYENPTARGNSDYYDLLINRMLHLQGRMQEFGEGGGGGPT